MTPIFHYMILIECLVRSLIFLGIEPQAPESKYKTIMNNNPELHQKSPIGIGLCRVKVKVVDLVPSMNQAKVKVIEVIGYGRSYSGYQPKENDEIITDLPQNQDLQKSNLYIMDIIPPMEHKPDLKKRATIYKVWTE
jgi:hypothetical protein